MKYIVANWKSNKTIDEAKEWLEEIFNFQFSIFNLKIILAASFIHLPILKELIQSSDSAIHLAAQNISPFPSGPYTGEISAEMLKDLVDYVIVGHSERRRLFGETDKIVAKKVKQALQYQITPIVCLDEPYIRSQFSIFNFQFSNLIFAYEPLAAIGSGKPDTPENANQVAETIKKITNKAPVLYGGSVNSENAQKFMTQDNIDGLLVGNASLDPLEFSQIIKNAKTQA